MPLTADANGWKGHRDSKRKRQAHARARRAEVQYGVQLRKVARVIEDICKAFDPTVPAQQAALRAALIDYGRALRPWARAVGARMLQDVSRRDLSAWKELANRMGYAIQREIEEAPTGELMQQLLADQVHLITSLPLDAAQRVHEITIGNRASSERPESMVEAIMQSGNVSRARANLIARTETARTAANLTEARARHIGSPGYVWACVHDSRVRSRHLKLDGHFFRWDDPPVAGENGERYNPGCGPNCRCTARVLLPESKLEAELAGKKGK